MRAWPEHVAAALLGPVIAELRATTDRAHWHVSTDRPPRDLLVDTELAAADVLDLLAAGLSKAGWPTHRLGWLLVATHHDVPLVRIEARPCTDEHPDHR